jgi:ribosomal protein S18 acetylase RimI-like enzyme
LHLIDLNATILAIGGGVNSEPDPQRSATDNPDEESNPTSFARLVLTAMVQHSIILRAAKPTFDEGLVFARYLDQAAEGFFRIILGRRVADIVATAYTQPNNDYSHQNVTLVERDEVIVGMVSGYTAEQHRCFSEQPLKLAAGYRALRMVRVAICCAPFRRFLDTLADGDFYVQAIAIDKELRGEGIGSTLIDSIEDRARATGSARLSLDVAAKNKGARRLYERRGMTVESGWPRLLFLPQLLVRMTKSL